MTFLWSFIQILVVLGVIGFGIYYSLIKIKKTQFEKGGKNGKIIIEDGMMLNHQTTSYLLNVDGQQLFIAVGPNGTETTILREKRFRELMNEDLREGDASK